MLPSDLDRVTPLQRLILEQAFVLAKEPENAVESAPRGQVVDRCESLLLGHGRDFLRRALESSSQSRAEALEKRGADLICSYGATGRHKGNSSKTVMTALGAVVVWRAYFACRACGLGGYVAGWVGEVDGASRRRGELRTG